MNKIEELKKDIDKNSITHGSLPFWSWNDRLDEDELRRQIRIMKKLGMNGFFMHARCGLETEYLSDEWHSCVKACIDEAKKQGMEAWAYDENGWPSGFAGGILLDDTANQAQYLELAESESYPECDEFLLGVYILSGDTLSKCECGCGAEKYYSVYMRRDSSYVDTLDASVTAQFIAATHEEYKKRIAPEDFGTAMPGFFTDEPQYFRTAVPWSKVLPEIFEREYGYSIYSALPAMFIDFDGAEKFRYDYYRLCHLLFINNFIKPIYEWCEANGCRVTGHAVEESTLSGQMWCCGGVMPFYEYEHIPGIDYLGRGLSSDIAPKQLGSVCAQLGKKKAISEMFACCGWDVKPSELKRIAELQYAGGVNMMCQHLYSYTERGQRKRDYPAHYSEHNPWQPYLSDFDRFFNNLGYTLSLGEEYATALVIHPIHSAWMRYKRHLDAASIEELEGKFSDLVGKLSSVQLPYHFGDETMMARLASVKKEGDSVRLIVGRCAYKYVILPFVYTIDSSTERLLREFISLGGRVYLYDGRPYAVDGRKADLSFLSSNCTFDEISEDRDALLSSGGGDTSDLRMTVRITDFGRIFYIVNLSDHSLRDIKLRIKNCDGVVSLDMDDLKEGGVAYTSENGEISARFDLGSCESVVFVEKSGAAPDVYKTEEYETIVLPRRMKFVSRPENCINLDCAQISYDGINYGIRLPIPCIKDKLYRARYEGRLWVRYSFEICGPIQKIHAAVEPMKNCLVEINGEAVSSDDGYFYDRTFCTYDITRLIHTGVNSVTVSFDYFQREHVYHVLFDGVSESLRNCLSFDTEVESIYLFGDFKVITDTEKFTFGERESLIYNGGFKLSGQDDSVDCTDIVRDGYPFYGGLIDVKADYEYKRGGAAVLSLQGRYSLADVYVGGEHAGLLMFKNKINLLPYLREGINEIEIKLYNSMRNLMGPHHRSDPEPYAVSPDTFSFEGEWQGDFCPEYKERYSFVHFGIN